MTEQSLINLLTSTLTTRDSTENAVYINTMSHAPRYPTPFVLHFLEYKVEHKLLINMRNVHMKLSDVYSDCGTY